MPFLDLDVRGHVESGRAGPPAHMTSSSYPATLLPNGVRSQHPEAGAQDFPRLQAFLSSWE